MNYINQGGLAMWIILIFVIAAVGLTIKNALTIFRKKEFEKTSVTSSLDRLLWMGILSLITGIAGTLLGIYLAAGQISMSREVSTQIIWGGIKVSILPVLFGIEVLLIVSLIRLGLKYFSEK